MEGFGAAIFASDRRAMPSESPALTAGEEWRRGWPLVVAAMLGVSIATLHVYSFGSFLAPLEKSFGWTRTEATSGLTLCSMVSAVLNPFGGALVDRFGARRVALIGVLLFTAAFAQLALNDGSMTRWWGSWLLIALLFPFISPTVWSSTVARAFAKARGLALAITLAGASLGAAVLPMVATLLVSSHGWRIAYAVIGAGACAIVLPIALLAFRAPRSPVAKTSDLPAGPLPGLDLRRALRSPQFIKLALVSFLFVTGVMAIVVQFVTILSEKGIESTEAGRIAGVIGLASIVGRLGAGFLLDRMAGARIASFAFLLPIIAIGLVVFGGSDPRVALVAAAILGAAVGSELDVIAYFTTRYLGLRHYGALFGILIGIQTFGTGVSQLLVGKLHDITHGYGAALATAVGLIAISIPLVASLGPYRFAIERHKDDA
jgi:MFS family permease